MGAHGRRLLGWAVHLAFFAAWWQVASLMDGQMRDAPKAPVPEAAAAGLPPSPATPASPPRQAEGPPLAAGEGRVFWLQLGIRAT